MRDLAFDPAERADSHSVGAHAAFVYGNTLGLRDIHLTAVVEARAEATSTKHSSAIVLR